MRRFYQYSCHRNQSYVGFILVSLAILVYLSMDFIPDCYHDPDEFLGSDFEEWDLIQTKD